MSEFFILHPSSFLVHPFAGMFFLRRPSGEVIDWLLAAQRRMPCYDILAASRPGHPLARLAHPWARRFGRDSVASMQHAVTVE